MSSSHISAWIASFIYQSLSLYLNQLEPNDHVVDDGSCIIFPSKGIEPKCYIHSWKAKGPGPIEVSLMDTEYQINATITDNSQVPSDTNPRSFIIKLLDFDLILRYSSTAPGVNLQIKRLEIDWERGAQRYENKSGLRKNQTFRDLVKKIRQNAANDSSTIYPNISNKIKKPSSPPLQLEPQENIQESSFNLISTQQLFSQVLPSNNEGSEVITGLTDGPSKNDLLQLLQPCRSGGTPTGSRSATPDPRIGSIRTTANETKEISDPTERKISPQSTPRKNGRYRESSIVSQASQTTASPPNPLVTLSVQPGTEGSQSKTALSYKDMKPSSSMSKKRPRENEDTISVTRLDAAKDNTSRISSPIKRQRLGEYAENQSLSRNEINKPTPVSTSEDHCTGLQPNSTNQSLQQRPSPWEGMDGIADVEVYIPKEQRALFESPHEAWIPPKAGQPWPQAHVPISLLKIWNEVAVRKKQDHERNNAATEQRLPQYQQPEAQEPESQDPQTQNTDESVGSDQESQFSWSPSPEPQPERHHLPPSSPVIGNISVNKDRVSQLNDPPESSQIQNAAVKCRDDAIAMPGPKRDTNDTGSQDAKQFSAAKGQDGIFQDEDEMMAEPQASFPGSTDKREQTHQPRLSPGLGIQTEIQAVIPKSPKHSSPLEPTIVPLEVESDDESVMDTSVPVALGEVFPDPSQSSQAAQELINSGSSLPGMDGERVQVNETPALGGNHLQYRNNPFKRPEPGSSNPHPPSSQTHKSSSQSRILNTFPPRTSQEGSHSSRAGLDSTQSQDGEAVRVEVPWTQPQASMNSTSQSQDASTGSQSEVVLDSSEPAQRHGNFTTSGSGSSQISSSLNLSGSHEHSQSQPVVISQKSPVAHDEVGRTPCPLPRKAPGSGQEVLSEITSPSGRPSDVLERSAKSEPVAEAGKPRSESLDIENHSSQVLSSPMRAEASRGQSHEPMSSHPQPSGSSKRQPVPVVEIVQTQPFRSKRASTTARTADADVDARVEEIDETDLDDIDEFDDTRHETASVELGDESFVSNAGQVLAESTPSRSEVQEDEPESEDENWFVSLHHVRQLSQAQYEDPRPWFDHPNAPFKKWAKVDMNVLGERRRRGGSMVQLDEKGVIRRLTNR